MLGDIYWIIARLDNGIFLIEYENNKIGTVVIIPDIISSIIVALGRERNCCMPD